MGHKYHPRFMTHPFSTDESHICHNDNEYTAWVNSVSYHLATYHTALLIFRKDFLCDFLSIKKPCTGCQHELFISVRVFISIINNVHFKIESLNYAFYILMFSYF